MYIPDILYFITNLGDTFYMLSIFLLISIYLHNKHKDKVMLTLIFAGLFASSATYTLKDIFKIPRPLEMLYIEDGYRFPSGHATIAAVFASFIIYYFSNYEHNKIIKYIAYIFAVSWAVLISYTRIYFGVHYLIDVIVGGLIGIICFFSSLKLFRHLSLRK